jgi:hypothetical protein
MRWGWGLARRADELSRRRQEYQTLTTKAGRSGNTGREKYNTSNRGSAHERCDVTEAHPEQLATAIELVTSDGDCIMFSRTSDGGALHIRILSEGTVAKWYLSNVTELETCLQGIIDDLRDVTPQ